MTLNHLTQEEIEKADAQYKMQLSLKRYNQARAHYVKGLSGESLHTLQERENEIGRELIPMEILRRYYAELRDYAGAITYTEELNSKLADIRPAVKDIDWNDENLDELIYLHTYDWNVWNDLNLAVQVKGTKSSELLQGALK